MTQKKQRIKPIESIIFFFIYVYIGKEIIHFFSIHLNSENEMNFRWGRGELLIHFNKSGRVWSAKVRRWIHNRSQFMNSIWILRSRHSHRDQPNGYFIISVRVTVFMCC